MSLEELRNMRRETGKTIDEVAGEMRWPKSKLSKIETGRQKLTVEMKDELMNYYNRIINKDNLDQVIVEATNLFLDERKYAVENNIRKDSKAGSLFKNVIPAKIIKQMELSEERFDVQGSIGQGNYAEIPWVCVFNKKITQSATKGIYIVQLYKKDGSGMYLGLGQGITYFREKYASKNPLSKARNVALNLRKIVDIPDEYKLDKIDLNCKTPLGKGYEAGFIAGIYYDFTKMPDEKKLIEDHKTLMEIYDNIVDLIGDKRNYEQLVEYLLAMGKGVVFVDEHNLDNEPELDIRNEGEEKAEIEPKRLSAIVDKPIEKKEPVVAKDGRKMYPRNTQYIEDAIRAAEFKCEYDEEHKSFQWAKHLGKNYMEGHHLIPISKHEHFEHSLDVYANIVCLCDTCHACIHHGTKKDKKNILESLYEDRKERLKMAGIEVSLEELLKYYDIVR